MEYQKKLVEKYDITDKGDASWVLGMEVTRDRKNRMIILTQQLKEKNILKRFGMQDCDSNKTPAEMERPSARDCPATIEEEKLINAEQFRAMVGALMYLSITTRPDIACAVSQLSRYMANPGRKHIIAAKRILRYLKGTSRYGLKFDGGLCRSYFNDSNKQITITALCDADWGGDPDERKSRTGYIIKVNGCIVSWTSKLQKTVSTSSAEAEYMAISSTVKEIIWIQQVLQEITGNTVTMETPLLYCDNQAAIAISKNDIHHDRTKHIDISHHFIRQKVKEQKLILEWISTKEQVADILTKPLGSILFQQFRDKIVFA